MEHGRRAMPTGTVLVTPALLGGRLLVETHCAGGNFVAGPDTSRSSLWRTLCEWRTKKSAK